MALDVKTLVHGIKLLTAIEGAKQHEQTSSFVENLELLLKKFESFASQRETLSLVLAAKQEQFHISVGPNDTLYWKYTATSLCLLCVLVDLLSEEQLSRPATSSPPHAPKHMLGVTDHKFVQCLVQRIVYVGIYPYLLPGVDNLTKLRLSHFSGATKVALPAELKTWYLAKCCQMLLRCIEEQTVGSLVITHHLSDLLVALVQVCYGPTAVDSTGPRSQTGHAVAGCAFVGEDERAGYVEALNGLLDRVHQPIVVRELLCLQSGGMPKVHYNGGTREQDTEAVKNFKWLQRMCGRLLSERLMKKNGVQSVLRGILDAMAGSSEGPQKEEDSAQNWKKCKAIAQIMAHCPYQAQSQDGYYSVVCPQVLGLLHVPADETQRQILRVTVAIMEAMVAQNRPLAEKYLINPLLQPLEVLCTEGDASSNQIATEERLHNCINDLCKMCGVMEVTSPLVSVFTQYLPVIFELSRLGCNAQGHTELSGQQTRPPPTVVLCFLLSAATSSVALNYFMSCFVTLPDHSTADLLKHVNPYWSLSSGSSLNQPVKVSRTAVCNESGLLEVDKMEGAACHAVSLLRSELRSLKLAGELCLVCLSSIERVLHKAVHKPGKGAFISRPAGEGGERAASSVLLELEEDSTAHVPLLFLIAALCEHLTMEVIEQADIHQMLEKLLKIVTVYADFVGSAGSNQEQGLLLLQPDLDSLPGSAIPLSISMGLLSSIMGGARKVDREDRPLLSQLLHPLEVISSHCPDPELQTQASELRICIATMGAVWSSELDKTNINLMEKAKNAGKKETKSKLIEELPGPASSGTPATTASNKHPAGVGEHPKGVKGHPAGCKNEHAAQPSAFRSALADIQDPLLPVQAHGLLELAKLIEARDTEALANAPSALVIFKENLKHTDSYVYLAAIDGLIAMGTTTPKDIIPLLCQEYIHFSNPEVSAQEKGMTEKIQHALKLGEALVRVARALGDILPHYSETLLSAIMVNLRNPDITVRTSALSNLANVCGLLHWSFGRIQNEVLAAITNILQTDKEPSVRQAALLVLKLLIKGLSQDAIQLLGGSLRDVYRLLKQVEATEEDPVTRTHAQTALGELDSIMRAYLFPKETLTKKISVLDHPI